MSFGDFLGGIVGKGLGFITGALTGNPWIGTALGAGLNFLGGERQNAANAQQAMAMMKFQRDMSNTSYQRAVLDMRAAGLNPALAYVQGGASTPSGAMASIPNNTLGQGVNTAIQAAQAYNMYQNTKSDTELKKAQANQARAQEQNIRVNSAKTAAEIPKKEFFGEWWKSWNATVHDVGNRRAAVIPNNARSAKEKAEYRHPWTFR